MVLQSLPHEAMVTMQKNVKNGRKYFTVKKDRSSIVIVQRVNGYSTATT